MLAGEGVTCCLLDFQAAVHPQLRCYMEQGWVYFSEAKQAEMELAFLAYTQAPLYSCLQLQALSCHPLHETAVFPFLMLSCGSASTAHIVAQGTREKQYLREWTWEQRATIPNHQCICLNLGGVIIQGKLASL